MFKHKIYTVFQVGVAQMMVLWGISPDCIRRLFRRFGGNCFLHLQADKI